MMSKAAGAIDVVVPAHNEGASIGDTLRDFYSIVAVQNHIPIRFVVCEDGSTDDTVPVIERLRVCPKTSGGITKFSEHEAD